MICVMVVKIMNISFFILGVLWNPRMMCILENIIDRFTIFNYVVRAHYSQFVGCQPHLHILVEIQNSMC
jgi:hypothetical protein